MIMALNPLICALVTVFTLQSFVVSAAAKKTYIVRVKYHQKPASYSTHADWYADHLRSLDSLLYSYDAAYHGFAATLDLDEVVALRRLDYVLGVYEDRVYTLHTTRTPKFLGIDHPDFGRRMGLSLEELDRASEDVIIGVVDSGFWPESKSFSNINDLPGPPAKWRGVCESGPDFDPKIHCNNKVIGARFFSSGMDQMLSAKNKREKNVESRSPRDIQGHGTHTASTIAGFEVANVSLYGYAKGTARGMATRARLAIYKVCWKVQGCALSDVLAGMDSAIHDGVDILSLSLGSAPEPYDEDPIAIGAFAAMEKGILVSCAAGNSGPRQGTVTNVAPWILTVGAGTIDRDFPAFATLGNGHKYKGVSLYSGEGMGKKKVELFYFKDTNYSSINSCDHQSLKSKDVRGKVVVCDSIGFGGMWEGVAVKEAGGVGVILANTKDRGEEAIPDSYIFPTVAVGWKTGEKIRHYVKTHQNPTVLLSFGGTVVNVKPSPMVAGFSSRGSNSISRQILKPDVISPGVNILAAWSGAAPPSLNFPPDTRRTPFNIISGTSMACPHISGISALLKAKHPSWSPSAIKSALMTTAYRIDDTGSNILLDAFNDKPSTPSAFGAGHVDPKRALSPGLVYDATTEDYIAFLCSSNLSTEVIETITRRPNVTCGSKFRDPGQLNYPSIVVVFDQSSRVVRYTRELTNVGAEGSVYQAVMSSPLAVSVDVKPSRLVFPKVGDKRRYTATFVLEKDADPRYRTGFGSIIWGNGKNIVNTLVTFSW